MHARVQRLEQARQAPRSPFEVAYGSLEAWEADVHRGIDSGTYDPIDMPVVIRCVRKWHADGLWLGLRWVPVRDYGR
jgi:hypothetical protein